jgi:hypothetical protein
MKLKTFLLLGLTLILLNRSAFSQTAQTISFDSIPNVTLGDNPILLSPTATSGLSVTLSTSSGNINLSNDSVSFLASGSASVTASQNGNGTFSPATNVVRTFCVNPPQPIIYLSETLGQVSLTSSSSTGIQWFYNGAPINGATGLNFNVVNAGIYSLQITIAGCQSEKSADEVVQSLAQTITFDPIPDVAISDSPIILAATSTPGLFVSFSPLTSNVSMIDSSAYLLKAGRATIVASQEGNYIFNAAAPVEQSFCINPAQPTISLSDGSNGVLLTSSNDTGNQWYLEGAPISGATSNPYSPSASGNYTVQTVTPDGCKSVLSDVAVVESAAQSITFGPLPDVTLSDQTLGLSASATSGLAVVFLAATSNVSITGSTANLLAPGHATVTATQPGNAIFFAAPTISQTFCINPSKPVISITGVGTGGLILSSSNAEGNQWFRNDTTLVGATGQTIIADTIGVYTVQSIVDNCVGKVSNGQSITITGMALDKEHYMKLYPNPAKDYIRIEVGNPSGSLALVVIDLLGRIINESAINGGKTEVNTSNYVPGIYLVKVNQNGLVYFGRFIKF